MSTPTGPQPPGSWQPGSWQPGSQQPSAWPPPDDPATSAPPTQPAAPWGPPASAPPAPWGQPASEPPAPPTQWGPPASAPPAPWGQPASTWQPAATPQPPKRNRAGLIIGIVAGVVVLGIACCAGLVVLANRLPDPEASATPSVTPTPDLTAVPVVGTCYSSRSPSLLDKAAESDDVVPCAQPHELETIAAEQVPASTDYPGHEIDAARPLFQQCEDKAKEFLGVHWGSTYTQLTLSLPSEEAWEQGATWFRCDLGAVAKLWGPVTQSTGSLRDTARPITCMTWDRDLATDEVSNETGIDCDVVHDAELAASFPVPDLGDAAYGSNEYFQILEDACDVVVLDFLGRSQFGANLIYWYYYPLSAGNLDQNVYCFVIARDGRRFIGSVKGVGDGTVPYV